MISTDREHWLVYSISLLKQVRFITTEQDLSLVTRFMLSSPYRLDGLASSVSLRPSGLIFGFMCATINGKSLFTNSYNKRVASREQAVEFLELSLSILKEACDEVSCS